MKGEVEGQGEECRVRSWLKKMVKKRLEGNGMKFLEVIC